MSTSAGPEDDWLTEDAGPSVSSFAALLSKPAFVKQEIVSSRPERAPDAASSAAALPKEKLTKPDAELHSLVFEQTQEAGATIYYPIDIVLDLASAPSQLSNVGHLGGKLRPRDFQHGIARRIAAQSVCSSSSIVSLPHRSWGHSMLSITSGIGMGSSTQLALVGGDDYPATGSDATRSSTWLTSSAGGEFASIPEPANPALVACLQRQWSAAVFVPSTGSILRHGGAEPASATTTTASAGGGDAEEGASGASSSSGASKGSGKGAKRRKVTEAPADNEADVNEASESPSAASAASSAAPVDLLTFDPSLSIWFPIETKGKAPPSGLSGHTLSVVSDVGTGAEFVVLFGGVKGRKFSCDTYLLNPRTFKWQQVKTFGKAPTQRAYHTASVVSRGRKLVVFGGSNGCDTFNDVFVLDVSSGVGAAAAEEKWVWEQPAIKGRAPRPRPGASAAVIGDRFIVISGGIAPCDPETVGSAASSSPSSSPSPLVPLGPAKMSEMARDILAMGSSSVAASASHEAAGNDGDSNGATVSGKKRGRNGHGPPAASPASAASSSSSPSSSSSTEPHPSHYFCGDVWLLDTARWEWIYIDINNNTEGMGMVDVNGVRVPAATTMDEAGAWPGASAPTTSTFARVGHSSLVVDASGEREPGVVISGGLCADGTAKADSVLITLPRRLVEPPPQQQLPQVTAGGASNTSPMAAAFFSPGASSSSLSSRGGNAGAASAGAATVSADSASALSAGSISSRRSAASSACLSTGALGSTSAGSGSCSKKPPRSSAAATTKSTARRGALQYSKDEEEEEAPLASPDLAAGVQVEQKEEPLPAAGAGTGDDNSGGGEQDGSAAAGALDISGLIDAAWGEADEAADQ